MSLHKTFLTSKSLNKGDNILQLIEQIIFPYRSTGKFKSLQIF